MAKIKTGVVGVGSLGQHHAKWLARMDTSDLVGVYDTNRERAALIAADHDCKAFESLEELAQAVEAVSVVVPTTAHAEIASLLIEHGIHCLIEKPVTSNLEQARRLEQLLDKSNVKVAVGHIERFNPAVQAVLNAGVEPAFIEAHRLAAFDPRGTDVAVVRDLMIHDIDLILTLTGSRVADIQASAVAVVSDQADIANARLTMENGAVANVTASRISLNQMRKLRIFQKSGYFSLDLARRQADLYRLAEPGSETPGFRVPIGKSDRELVYSKSEDTGEDQLKQELAAFLEAVADDRPVAVPLQQGIEALRVAIEIERAGEESLRRMLAGA